jgi:drug/metabolite transporter (DMT)-like permease
VWVGISAALAGVVILSGVDLSVSAGALGGDALALAGAGFGAAYVILGADIRQRASTTAYTTICYPTAALLLLVACLVAWQPLAGYPGPTWLALAGLGVGPQLLGHSLANRVVREAGPTIVSVAILGEIVGASVLAAIWFGEVPPAGTIPAAVLIGAGIVTVIRAEAAR